MLIEMSSLPLLETLTSDVHESAMSPSRIVMSREGSMLMPVITQRQHPLVKHALGAILRGIG